MFAAAVGFAAGVVGLGAAATISAVVAGSVGTFSVLRRIPADNRTFDLPAFEPVPLELAPEAGGELLLDDRLERAAPDARVVQLFGPGHHSGPATSSGSSNPDASQALVEALLELRRSLR
ncbi:MAG: hypothetical protein ACR2KH_07410 [Sphingomicrobium sp.]